MFKAFQTCSRTYSSRETNNRILPKYRIKISLSGYDISGEIVPWKSYPGYDISGEIVPRVRYLWRNRTHSIWVRFLLGTISPGYDFSSNRLHWDAQYCLLIFSFWALAIWSAVLFSTPTWHLSKTWTPYPIQSLSSISCTRSEEIL